MSPTARLDLCVPMTSSRWSVSPSVEWASDGWVDYANISWNPVFCKRCDICVDICPKNTLVLRNDAIIEEDNCILCGLCERYCPDLAIEIDFTHNQSPFSFHTDDQSIWGSGSGKPFDFNELIGLDNKPFSFDTLFFPEAPLPVPFLDVEIAGHVTFGFQTVVHLDAGRVVAQTPIARFAASLPGAS